MPGLGSIDSVVVPRSHRTPTRSTSPRYPSWFMRKHCLVSWYHHNPQHRRPYAGCCCYPRPVGHAGSLAFLSDLTASQLSSAKPNRSRSLPLRRGSIPSGLVDSSWPPFPPSKICGVRDRSTTNLVLLSFAAVEILKQGEMDIAVRALFSWSGLLLPTLL